MARTRTRLKRYIELANKVNQAINSRQPADKVAKLDSERSQAAMPALDELRDTLAPNVGALGLLDDVSAAIENELANVQPPGCPEASSTRKERLLDLTIRAIISRAPSGLGAMQAVQ